MLRRFTLRPCRMVFGGSVVVGFVVVGLMTRWYWSEGIRTFRNHFMLSAIAHAMAEAWEQGKQWETTHERSIVG